MKHLIYLLAFVITFSSCERVIDINLKNADKKYVVEGNVVWGTTNVAEASVLITTTKNFDEDNNFTPLTNAVVTITVNNAAPVTLLPSPQDGIYKTSFAAYQAGTSYTLKVLIDGQEFTATSVMPAKVLGQSLFVSEENLFGDLRKFANVVYEDPVGKGNAYRFVQYLNNRKEKTLFVRDDDLIDGKAVERRLLFFNDNDDERRDLKTGDALRIEMQCIDYPIYRYWYSLDAAATGSNQQATPANPVSNIKGGALGYFSAHTSQTMTTTVP